MNPFELFLCDAQLGIGWQTIDILEEAHGDLRRGSGITSEIVFECRAVMDPPGLGIGRVVLSRTFLSKSSEE